jgi:hypothetical protein
MNSNCLCCNTTLLSGSEYSSQTQELKTNPQSATRALIKNSPSKFSIFSSTIHLRPQGRLLASQQCVPLNKKLYLAFCDLCSFAMLRECSNTTPRYLGLPTLSVQNIDAFVNSRSKLRLLFILFLSLYFSSCLSGVPQKIRYR